MQGVELTQDQIDNLPIDISATKLLDWLIDRRHVDRKWLSSALVIREKINNAIQDMPAVDEITQLVSGTYINYFHCCRIVELLKETEAGSKNIFGYYSSTRMKDWQEIIKLYEKDNIYLAEAADMLIRNVSYEIPGLKKQIAKCEQSQKDCERKEKDYESSAAEQREQYNTACKQFGIQGKKVKSELLQLVKDLPVFYEDVVEKTKNLQKTCDFYKEFVCFTSAGSSDSESKLETTSLVRYIINNGNTTVYQWRTGEAPSRVEEIQMDISDDDDNKSQEDEIDWGDLDEGEVDYGITVDQAGIEVQSESTDDGDLNVSEKGVAMGMDALTVLDSPSMRSTFIDELLELEGFLLQRLNEMKGESDILSASQFQSAPVILQMQGTEQVNTMLAQVQAILKQLTTVRIQQLFLIKGSPKYVDKLTDTLKEKLEHGEKMLASKKAVIDKRHSFLEEQRKLEPKLDILIKRTKELQAKIEVEISKRYKNRPVNLMGSIRQL
ncbi:CDK5 regulatory subunit-associated protein 3-like [Saccoglossus kowalevskii]|uniref:CDK5 regulatory subunit-associated protein 3-like n=1 Tax=Saccoglossus kowalevskii TaxID=10224 RepID=A0ABM0GKT5_SACKO|nr:PREDICTED: CDK5 regulatory subunit-associated protein 3-like [Saccoglossus kowalevskii]